MLLDPPRGATILDMCAAPGMKTSHLAAHIKNKGTIYAVEQHVRRYSTLCEIMANTRSSAVVQTINQDALALEDEGVPGVEYVLVDPSCSGSGMTGRLFSTPEEKETDRLVLLCGLQMRMLQHAMRAFYGARRIVYSTCSVHVEENEQVVARCLEACPEWELVKPAAFAERWKHFGSPKWKHVGKKCFYAKPEVDLTDGFFVALFQRREGEEGAMEGRVHDPDRDFLEEIHRNFTRKPGYGVAEENGEEENAGAEFPVGNPFGQTNAAVVEPPVHLVPVKQEKQIKLEPIETPTESEAKTSPENVAEIAEAKIKKEKKRKHDKSAFASSVEVVPSEATAAETPGTKKKRKHKVPEHEVHNAAVKVEPVEEEIPKKKKKKSSKTTEDQSSEAAAPIAEEEIPKKKEKKNSKTADKEIAPIAEDIPKKKSKKSSKPETEGASCNGLTSSKKKKKDKCNE